MINVKNDDISPLMGRFRYIDTEEYAYGSVANTVGFFATNFVFPNQREEFKEFLDIKTIIERVEAGKKGIFGKSISR